MNYKKYIGLGLNFTYEFEVCYMYSKLENVNKGFLDSRLWPTLSCLVAETSWIPRSATLLPQQQSLSSSPGLQIWVQTWTPLRPLWKSYQTHRGFIEPLTWQKHQRSVFIKRFFVMTHKMRASKKPILRKLLSEI